MTSVLLKTCILSIVLSVLSSSTPVLASSKFQTIALDIKQSAKEQDKAPILQLVDGKLPEPESWELMFTGMALVGFSVRYRKRMINRLDV